MCSSPPSLALQLESFAKQAEFTVYHPFMTPSTVRRQSKCFLWPYLPFCVMQTPSCLLTPLPHPYLHLYSSCPELLFTGSIVVLCSLPGFSVCCSFYPECFSRVLPSLYLADTYSSIKTHLRYPLQQEALSDLQSGSEASFGTPTVPGLPP